MSMDDSARGALEFTAVQLAAVVAGLHLYWGIPRLVTAVRIDQPIYWDPRPLLFVSSAVGILVAVLLVRQRVLSRVRAYVLGIGLMLTYILSWAYWHLAGHTVVVPWIQRTPEPSHDTNPLFVLAEHLVGSPIDGVSKTAETLLLLVLVVLLYEEYTSGTDPSQSRLTADSPDGSEE